VTFQIATLLRYQEKKLTEKKDIWAPQREKGRPQAKWTVEEGKEGKKGGRRCIMGVKRAKRNA